MYSESSRMLSQPADVLCEAGEVKWGSIHVARLRMRRCAYGGKMVSKLGFSVCRKRIFQLLCLPALTFLLTSAASAADLVRFRQGAEEVSSPGKVLVHAVDGGVLLLTPVGVLVPLSGTDVVDVESDPTPFQPALPDEVAEYWLQRLPQGFVV